MGTRIIWFAALSAMAGFCHGNLALSAFGAEQDCRKFRAALPSDFIQGEIEVPEDWNSPRLRRIRVFFYGSPSSGDHTPIVFFNGGPASDSHSTFEVLKDVPERAGLPLIFIDQRGTGCSSPYPTEANAETVRRLAHYGTRAIVKDAEAIRTSLLGHRKWRAFGQSYGGMIAQRYLELAPEGLESVHVHGFATMSDPLRWHWLRLKSQKRVVRDYFREYPWDEKDLTRLREGINPKLCFSEGSRRICGPAVLDALTVFLGFRNYWPYLHHWVDYLLFDSGSVNTYGVEQFVKTFVFGVYAENDLPSAVISRLEVTPGQSDTALCETSLERLRNEGENPDSWPLNECRLILAMRNDAQDRLVDESLTVSDPLTPGAVLEALTRHPDLPFFLYSGAKDAFVPTETFEEETSALGSLVRYENFPDSGHEGYYTEKRVWRDLGNR